ncbi:hypothetical protein K7G98_36770, partial [Saccharothrix sp. MB29]|nr:hypothetical protein [Saccharothrix sp. MB29]
GAGVSVPTVYAAYGDKAGLVRAVADAADLSADAAGMVDALEASASPEGQLAAMAAYDRRLFERSGDVIALVREAGRAEPELGAPDARGGRRGGGARGPGVAARAPGAPPPRRGGGPPRPRGPGR